ncbi:MAG: hypothetical protein ACIALR_00075, partial [Blastopirellula sp. JB062]
TWRRFFGDPPPTAQSSETIDTRVPRKTVEDQPVEGAFRVVPATPFTMNRGGAQLTPGEPTIGPELLAEIRDDTVFRQAEFAAWRDIFLTLQKMPGDALTPAQAEPVQFAQLYRQPDEYRGKLVAISGVIKRVVRVEAEREEIGVDHLWQIWLFSGADANPTVIYSLELPDQFPVGLKIDQPATAVGVFFKRWIYKGEGGVYTAPLLLSKNLAWSPPPPLQTWTPWQLTLGIALSVTAALAIAGLLLRKGNDADSKAERKIRARQAEQFRAQAGEIDSGVSVRDQLRIVEAEFEQRPNDQESDHESE